VHVRRIMILFGGIAVLALLLTPASSGASGATGVHAQTAGGTSQQLEQGRELYLQACASCHGPDPNGPSEYSTVPSLKDVGGAAAVDWAVRTGRMPFQSTKGPAIARGKSRFSEQETRALAAYVGNRVGDALIPEVDASKGNVAEAIKIGPGQMPPGGGLPEYTPTDQQSINRVNDVAAYVEALNRDRFNRGGAPIGGKGPVPEGFVAWVIGLGILILGIRWLGTRS
jgi:ubiquinol-cytochrome c reductase cytochrome c subunit